MWTGVRAEPGFCVLLLKLSLQASTGVGQCPALLLVGLAGCSVASSPPLGAALIAPACAGVKHLDDIFV